MNAAIYARYSSDNQREQSIEEQIREIREYAQDKGYTVVCEYCDFAISGESKLRPEFNRMLEDSGKGIFGYVLVFDYTRFSRGGEEGLADELILTRNNVILISITEDYGDTFGAKLIKHVKFLMAAEDLNKLRINVARGMKDNAVKALHNGGTPPLGYDVDPETKQYIVNESEAAAVRIIFEMFADRMPYSAIIAKLNALGYRTKRNNKAFAKNSLHDILANQKYIGVYEFGKISRKKSSDPKYKSSIVAGENVVKIEDGIPAIISKELWDRAQANVRTREPSKRAKVVYMLRNKLICGSCGGPMVGTSRRCHQKNLNYYICSARNNGKGCGNRAIEKNRLEEKIVALIWKEILSDIGIDWIIGELKRYNRVIEKSISSEDKAKLDKEIRRLQTRLVKAKEAYLNGVMTLDEFRAEKNKSGFNIEYLKQELADRKPISIDRSRIILKVEALKNEIMSDSALINAVVDKVIITGEKIDVYVNSFFLDLHKNSFGSPPPLLAKNLIR